MRLFRLATGVVLLGLAGPVAGQVRVNPTGVNVNAQGATTVFLTYGGLAGYRAAEAFWCGELILASPAIGRRCDPATIFGSLPLRYDRAGASGVGGLTDIMTIPPSVARRAYQAAESGAGSAFYYVRRFRSIEGGPDQYVVVTCRLTGGGARSPLSLTDVRVAFVPDVPVLQVSRGEPAPALEARISYTGTGRLVGRWEIVLPGDDPPTEEDLLTEATLPLERRGTQRRYQPLSRFNLFLPPNGAVTLPGPDPSRLPTLVDGVYYVLLRIEASQDKEGDSDLGAAGAGTGVVPSGGVAGFPMPVLRYLVGSGSAEGAGDAVAHPAAIRLLAPSVDAILDAAGASFSWDAHPAAAVYRIEFALARGRRVFAALVPAGATGYRAPPWLAEKIGDDELRWRVVGTDPAGREVTRSDWRAARFGTPTVPPARPME
ncbi:MAG: hypothetical protein IT352_09980 [Gemmatimonadales bacterium]|nr:hypothetical protein [Gemmatimonadales bacterium]